MKIRVLDHEIELPDFVRPKVSGRSVLIVFGVVFGLMVPREVTDMHHADIAMITNLLGNGELRSKLREATSSSALYNTLLDGTRASVPDRLQTAHGN